MEATADVPVGLSQTSYIVDDTNDDEDDTFGFVMANNDYDTSLPDSNSVSILQSSFYQMAESINNSISKEVYEKEVLDFFDKMSSKASGDCHANRQRAGKRISMFPPSSQRKKTHGTKHMNNIYKYK